MKKKLVHVILVDVGGQYCYTVCPTGQFSQDNILQTLADVIKSCDYKIFIYAK